MHDIVSDGRVNDDAQQKWPKFTLKKSTKDCYGGRACYSTDKIDEKMEKTGGKMHLTCKLLEPRNDAEG